MSIKCEKCGSELEQNNKFCTNCGEKVIKERITEDQSDISKKYLFVAFLFAIIPSALGFREHYNMMDVSLVSLLTSGNPEIYANIIGGAVGLMIFPLIIVASIWGIKSFSSKKYQTPILHIVIGIFIVSIMMILKRV